MLERDWSLLQRCESAWGKYKTLMILHQIRRTGVKNHGICIAPLYLADQNVLEHSYMAASLGVIMNAMFDELKPEFPPDFVATLLFHDVGESKIGDIADDGSADATKNKDELEYKFLADFVEDFDPETANNIMANFCRFQHKHGVLYMVDKIEWILFTGYLTPSGDAGSLNYKETHLGLTEQDRHAIEVTDGSTRTVDAMVVHFLEHTRGIGGRDVFVALLEAMYMGIDGFIPAFMGKLY